jgi:hypothetical protein
LKKRNNRWILVILSLGTIVTFVVAAFLLLAPPNPAESVLPTLIVLNTDSPTENPPTPENTATELPTETSSPAAQSSPTSKAITQTPPLDPDPTLTVTNTSLPQTSATNAAPVLPATATSGGLIVITPQNPAETAAPTISPQASATPAPVSTLDTTGLIGFNEAVNVGTGDLRVLSMTVPADEVILSLGGTVPAIQPNQQWVLVELFMVCPSTTNCAPAANSFSLQSNAHVYQPTPLAIESAFGDLMINDQVLGHLAFVIDRTESPFALQLNLGGQVYRFALQ